MTSNQGFHPLFSFSVVCVCVWRPLQVHSLQLARSGRTVALRQPAPPSLQRRPAGRPVAPRLRPKAGEPIETRQRAGPRRHHSGDSGGPGKRDPPGSRGGRNYSVRKEEGEEGRMVDFFLCLFVYSFWVVSLKNVRSQIRRSELGPMP